MNTPRTDRKTVLFENGFPVLNCTEVVDAEVARGLERELNTALGLLEALSVPSTYEGERIGGVLSGCARTEPPTPEQLATKVRIAVDAIRRRETTEPTAKFYTSAEVAAALSGYWVLANDYQALSRASAELIEQFCKDLNEAHDELMRAQGLPESCDWPEWTPQANSIRKAERLLGKKLAKTNQWTLYPEAV